MQKQRSTATPNQIDKFRDMARELECDEDEEAFRAKFKKVATARKPLKERPAK